MSAYIHIPMPMIDEECLVRALAECGFSKEAISVHDVPISLVGYEGSQRNEVAEIVIPRRYVGGASNDIGFKRTPTGYMAIISDYDRRIFNEQWRSRLSEKYEKAFTEKVRRLEVERKKKEEEELLRIEEAKRVAREEINSRIKDKAKKLGYSIEEVREGKTIQLVLVKRSY